MRMKKLSFVSILLLFSGLLAAQISLHFQFGSPPAWGPTGYSETRYYYLPDVEAYYDLKSSMFICFDGSRWIRRSHLPYRYRNYDLYNGYKVVMSDYRGNSPYTHFDEYRSKYGKGYRDSHQQTFREKNDNKWHEKNQRSDNRSNNSQGEKREHNKGENRGKGHNK